MSLFKGSKPPLPFIYNQIDDDDDPDRHVRHPLETPGDLRPVEEALKQDPMDG